MTKAVHEGTELGRAAQNAYIMSVGNDVTHPCNERLPGSYALGRVLDEVLGMWKGGARRAWQKAMA